MGHLGRGRVRKLAAGGGDVAGALRETHRLRLYAGLLAPDGRGRICARWLLVSGFDDLAKKIPRGNSMVRRFDAGRRFDSLRSRTAVVPAAIPILRRHGGVFFGRRRNPLPVAICQTLKPAKTFPGRTISPGLGGAARRKKTGATDTHRSSCSSLHGQW